MDRLHQPESLPWKIWFFQRLARDLGDKPTNPSFLYKIVAYCFPVYRALTRVTLRDGRRCSF